jgi:hypothetical protein
VKKDETNPYWFQKYQKDIFDGMKIELDELVFTTPGGNRYDISLKDGLKMEDRFSKIAFAIWWPYQRP